MTSEPRDVDAQASFPPDLPSYCVVTPVRDEAAHVPFTVRSMLAQTHRPLRWVIVDDGSKDGTGPLLDALCADLPWVRVLHRPDRGHRAAGSGVMEAVCAGQAELEDVAWDFIVKLDGDLSFGPDHFERCLQRFAAEPRLGLAGGRICRLEGEAWVEDSRGDPPFHVRGAAKVYRRACWNDIAPLPCAPGWDTVDELKANFRGWTTRTLHDLPLLQLKPTGAAAGRWADAFKNGRANYLTGYHPMFMLAKCAKRALRPPLLLGSLALLAGFSSGYLRRLPPICDAETVRYLRRQQVRRLALRPSIYGA